MEFTLRVRMSNADAHYAGNLVAGAKILALFGDAATGLLVQRDGDEGLFVAYDLVEFKAPVYAGDFIEVTARLSREGRTSRGLEFEAYKILASRPDVAESAVDTLNEPVLVARAVGTCVVPRERQRKEV
ncbi:MAG: 3-aminobutyryl-CoA ammonia lyase [Firmicutes bacterium]|nr:3-aminobutyryl-CoA ammonia lyase [Bacillota bacterium]